MYKNCCFPALDAYCLLEIYNLFKTKCEHSSIPFDEICQTIANNDHSEVIKPKPRHKKHKNVCDKNILENIDITQ